MKKSYLLFSFVGVLILGLFTFNVESAGASSSGTLDLNNLSAKEKAIVELHEKYVEPVKRSATEDEIEKINEAIEEKLETDNEFKMEEVLEELGLEDVGFQEPDSSDSVNSLNSDMYELGNGNEGISPQALNVGSVGFRSPSHTSTTFSATLHFTNIGFTRIGAFNGVVTPYTKTAGGAFVQNGAPSLVSEQNLRVGVTIIDRYSVPHQNRGARLVATGLIAHTNKVVTVSPATATYNAN